MRGLYSSSWLFLAVFLLISAANNLGASELNSQKDLQSAVVIGTVYCDACFPQDSRKSIHFIHGTLLKQHYVRFSINQSSQFVV